jgi:DNA-binding FadR family transcriptional regulator
MHPISRESAVDACARALRRSILLKEIAPDEQLPPERDLAVQLGVNRVTVRSALARLKAEGLLSVRQGSGHRVRDFHDAAGPDLIGKLAVLAAERGGRDLARIAEDLLLVRRHLARAAFERLALTIDATHRGAIGAAIDELERLVEQRASSVQLAEADMAIVSCLLRATESAVLQLCMNPIADVLGSMSELRDVLYRNPESNVAGYRMLRTWLEIEPAEARYPAIDALVRVLEERDRASIELLRRRSSRRVFGLQGGSR